jgi:hypothetical protein
MLPERERLAHMAQDRTLALRQFAALSRLTAVEAARQPVCLLLACTCVLLTAAVPMVMLHHFGEDGKLARDSGLAFHFVFGAFLAGYAASRSLAGELRSGTASTVLSKPVGRGLFYLAKLTGTAMLVGWFSLCAATATLLAERVSQTFVFTRALTGYYTDWQTGWLLLAAPFAALFGAGLINYAWRRPFGSAAFGLLAVALLAVLGIAGFFDRAGRPAAFDCRVDWRLLPVSFLVTVALGVLAALALALATRLKTVPTVVLVFAAVAAGLGADFALAGGGPAWLSWPAALAPNWQHFWMADALTGGGRVASSYVGAALAYGTVYAAAVTGAGWLAFRGAEPR